MEELDSKTIFTKKVPVYQDDKIVKYIVGNLTCLYFNNKMLTNYYSIIKYLKLNDYYKVAYNILENNNIVTRYKVIKLQRDENDNIIPFEEKVIINDLYRYIYYGGEQTLTVEKDGLYSYIDINPQSPSYLQTLYPFIFNMTSSFGLEYPLFAKVNIGLKKGYIYHGNNIVNDTSSYDLFTKEEVEYLNGLFHDAEKTAPEKLAQYAPKLTLHL